MLIQPITNQNYNKYQIQNRNNSTSFKGELGARVLKEISTSGAKDQKGISEVLKKLGLGFMGLFSLSKLTDIMETIVAKNDELEKEYQEKSENLEQNFHQKENELNAQVSKKQKQLDSREKELNEQADTRQKELEAKEQKLNEQVLERQKQLDNKEQKFNEQATARQEVLDVKEKSLAEKQQQLEEQEQTLISTKNILKQAEADSIKSATRVFYNIKDPELTSYDSIGEQCLEVSSILSGCEHVCISNFSSNTLQELAVAMQNKDGCFTKEALTFLSRIAPMHDFDINNLITTIKLVKDSVGNIDMERSAHFVALYSLKKSNMNSVNRDIAKYYISPSDNYSISDAQILFQLIGVKSKIDKEGLVIDGDVNLDATDKNSLCSIYDELNINLNELLKNVVEVNGNFRIFNNNHITALPKIKYIGGIADFEGNSMITELPNLVSIGGLASFRNTQIKDLPKLVSIGGDVYYKNSPLEEKLDWLKSVTRGELKEE